MCAVCVSAPEAACSKAASSAGIGSVVTFTTSLLMRSYTRCKHTYSLTLQTKVTFSSLSNSKMCLSSLSDNFAFFILRSPPLPSLQAPPLSDRKTTVSHFTHLFIFNSLFKYKYCRCPQRFPPFTQTQTKRAYPHVTLAVDDEQHGGAKPNEVLPPQSKLFSVQEKH